MERRAVYRVKVCRSQGEHLVKAAPQRIDIRLGIVGQTLHTRANTHTCQGCCFTSITQVNYGIVNVVDRWSAVQPVQPSELTAAISGAMNPGVPQTPPWMRWPSSRPKSVANPKSPDQRAKACCGQRGRPHNPQNQSQRSTTQVSSRAH